MENAELKKVLICTTHFAPAYKAGGIVRSLEHLVRNLDTSFEFTILTGDKNLNNEAMPGLITDTWLNFTPFSKIMYLSNANRTFNKLKELFVFTRPDVFYIVGIYSMAFALVPLLFSRLNGGKPIVVLAPCGALHKGNLAVKPLKKIPFYFLFKLLGFHKNIRWHATDDKEKDDIRRVFGGKAEIEFANIVPDLNIVPKKPIVKERGYIKLITVSLIIPNKGHLRLLNVLKDLENEISLEYHIYGPVKDEPFWETCKQVIASLKSNIKVIYHGFIDPLEVPSSLTQCHFFALLTQGENFCLAIYEALCAGRPLIISDQTPWNNLEENKAGFNVNINDKVSIARALKLAYNMDQETFDMHSTGAQDVAKRYVKESRFHEEYDQLFATA